MLAGDGQRGEAAYTAVVKVYRVDEAWLNSHGNISWLGACNGGGGIRKGGGAIRRCGDRSEGLQGCCFASRQTDYASSSSPAAKARPK